MVDSSEFSGVLEFLDDIFWLFDGDYQRVDPNAIIFIINASIPNKNKALLKGAVCKFSILETTWHSISDLFLNTFTEVCIKSFLWMKLPFSDIRRKIEEQFWNAFQMRLMAMRGQAMFMLSTTHTRYAFCQIRVRL